MVCIHSTYYIKIHLLCDIRDSIQAAGGMDSSILWPGKLLKMIVFCKQSPPHSGKKRPFLPLRKRPKSTHLLPYRYSAALYLKQEGTRFFISEPRPKERPIDGGPCKHPDRRSTVIPQRIIRRNRPFFTGLCSGWRTRLWEAKDVFRSSDLHK